MNVELEVEGAERVALIGPSGAGKSTTLRLIAGLHRADDGVVRLGDSVWLDTKRGIHVAPEERSCGMLFQSYALFGHMSAWRNVAYGLRGVSRGERRARAVKVMERFGVAHLADVRPGALSGGERQRVALARALASEPAVLLLDEPLAALDPATRGASIRELGELLDGLGVPTVIVSHDFSEAAQLASRVVVMEQGSVVQGGAPSEIAAKPASAFVAGFAGAVVLYGEAAPSGDLTEVALEGGGRLVSTDIVVGPVAASVYPWEIAISLPGSPRTDSALNGIPATVSSVTEIGNRVRVGLAAAQPLVAELTGVSAQSLGLRPGIEVLATWKATATRLTPHFGA